MSRRAKRLPASAEAPSFGLAARENEITGRLMPRPHAHSDLELNYVLSGGFTYFMAGRFERVERGRLVAFWAAMPHQTVEAQPDTRQVWVTVPLVAVLRWELPPALVRRLLRGELVADTEPERAGDAETLRRWTRDLAAGDPALRQATELEIRARLVRFAAEQERAGVRRGRGAAPVVAQGAFARLAAALHQRYRDPVALADVARGVGLSAPYAAQLFRRVAGMSPVAYRTRLRVAHAQRMLLLDDRSITEVALDSGFGSVGRFYAAFRAVTGETPRRFRGEGG